MDPSKAFEEEVERNVDGLAQDAGLRAASRDWLIRSLPGRYSYNFSWLGRPVIQYPQDIVALQELVWKVRPDLIIETGIAHGGSLILSASLLALLDLCDAEREVAEEGRSPRLRKVVGIDIEIRPHNRQAILAHPMANRIEMIEGSSIAPDVVARAQRDRSQPHSCHGSARFQSHTRPRTARVARVCSLGVHRELLRRL